jgi:hypothetical protein
MLGQMTVDGFVHPDNGGMPPGAARLHGPKHERGDVEIAGTAAVSDLLHLHVALARRAPRPVGLCLLLNLAVEIRRQEGIVPRSVCGAATGV